MAVRRKTDAEKYSRYIGLRLTESEYADLTDWSNTAGMNVSEFMRHAIRNDQINLTYTLQATFPDVTEAVMDMEKTMSGISASLSDISRLLKGGNCVDDEMRDAVIRMQTDIGAIRRKTDHLETMVNQSFKEFRRAGKKKRSSAPGGVLSGYLKAQEQ